MLALESVCTFIVEHSAAGEVTRETSASLGRARGSAKGGAGGGRGRGRDRRWRLRERRGRRWDWNCKCPSSPSLRVSLVAPICLSASPSTACSLARSRTLTPARTRAKCISRSVSRGILAGRQIARFRAVSSPSKLKLDLNLFRCALLLLSRLPPSREKGCGSPRDAKGRCVMQRMQRIPLV